MEVAAGAALVGGSFLLAAAKRGGKPRKSRKGSLSAPISAAVVAVAGAALVLGLKALRGRKERGGTQVPEEDTSEEAAALRNGHVDNGGRAEPGEASPKKDSEDVTEDVIEDVTEEVTEEVSIAIPDPPPPVSVSGTPDLKVKSGEVSAPETPVGIEREHAPSRLSATNDSEVSPFDTAPSSPFYSDALPDFDTLFGIGKGDGKGDGKGNGDGDGDERRERFHNDDLPSAVNVPSELVSERDADSPEGRGGVRAGVGSAGVAQDVSSILKRVKAAAARAEILHSKVMEMNHTEST